MEMFAIAKGNTVKIERLRRNLKRKWLNYYRENRSWLVKLGIWVSYDGYRRPSSSFILATVSVLEPQLAELFPLIVELSHDPDQVVEALGLDFDPDELLNTHQTNGQIDGQAVKMLPSGAVPEVAYADVQNRVQSQKNVQDWEASAVAMSTSPRDDDSCQGVRRQGKSEPGGYPRSQDFCD